MNLRCGQCLKPMMVSDSPKETVLCPFCKHAVIIVNEGGQTSHYADWVSASWKRPVGLFLFWLGIAAFIASFIYGGQDRTTGDGYRIHFPAPFNPEAGLLAAVLNPLAWIGIILGIMWGNLTGPKINLENQLGKPEEKQSDATIVSPDKPE